MTKFATPHRVVATKAHFSSEETFSRTALSSATADEVVQVAGCAPMPQVSAEEAVFRTAVPSATVEEFVQPDEVVQVAGCAPMPQVSNEETVHAVVLELPSASAEEFTVEETRDTYVHIYQKDHSKNLKNRKLPCFYCNNFFFQMTPHLQRKHGEEMSVASAVGNKLLLQSIVNQGIYRHNEHLYSPTAEITIIQYSTTRKATIILKILKSERVRQSHCITSSTTSVSKISSKLHINIPGCVTCKN